MNHNTFTKNIARQLDILPTLAILLRQPGAATGHAAVFLIRCVADVCDSNHANQEALAEAGLVEGLVGLLSSALADGLQGAQGQVALVQQLARAIGNAGGLLEGGAGVQRAVQLCGLCVVGCCAWLHGGSTAWEPQACMLAYSLRLGLRLKLSLLCLGLRLRLRLRLRLTTYHMCAAAAASRRVPPQ